MNTCPGQYESKHFKHKLIPVSTSSALPYARGVQLTLFYKEIVTLYAALPPCRIAWPSYASLHWLLP